MAKKPYVSVTGVDGLLLTLEGRFSTALDEALLDRSGVFLGELDFAARKVFRSMAYGATSRGIRANPVMGTNVKVPGFLAEFVPNDQKWEPLTKEYLKRKKRMVARGQISSSNMWKYSGDLIKYFSKNSTSLTQKTNNIFSRKFAFDAKTGSFGSKRITKRDKDDVLFIKIPAIGQGLGSSSKGYDFTYIAGMLSVKYPANHRTNPNGYARPQYIGNMQRQMSFNLFQGLYSYANSLLNNDPMGMSPENFIEEISVNSKKPVSFVNSRGETKYKMEVNPNANTKLKHKLYYFTGLKRSNRKQRGLIQPYMYYYATKIMKPLAQKLLREGRF